MREGQRKERELAERLAELGAKLDEIRARSSSTEELDALTQRHDALSAAAESLQEEVGQSWFETHEKLSDETADLSLRIKGLAETAG